MASPHIAGVATMSSGLGFPRDEIVECIVSTAVNPISGMRGTRDAVYGYGILDAERAVAACRAA